jgi:hypothetical protein
VVSLGFNLGYALAEKDGKTRSDLWVVSTTTR